MMRGDHVVKRKTQGDSGSAFEALLIVDCFLFLYLAGNYPLRLLGLLQQYLPSAVSITYDSCEILISRRKTTLGAGDHDPDRVRRPDSWPLTL